MTKQRRRFLTVIADYFDSFAFTADNSYLGSEKEKSEKATTGLIGYKQMHVRYSEDEIILSSIHHDRDEIKLIDEAKCPTYIHLATVPVASCTCGFHAYNNVKDAYRYSPRKSEMIVEVAISGKYLEYDNGYRCNTQRVKSILVRDCEWCDNPATVLHNAYSKLAPLCTSCASNILKVSKKSLISFEEASEALDTNVLKDTGFKNPEFVSSSGSVPLTKEKVTQLRRNSKVKEKKVFNFDAIFEYPINLIAAFLIAWPVAIFALWAIEGLIILYQQNR